MDLFDLRDWEGFKRSGGDHSKPACVDQISIDSRRIDSNRALFVPLKGDFVDGHQFIEQAARFGAKYALARHDWQAPFLSENFQLLRVDNPLAAFQEISRTYRNQKKCKVIGIAGSHGKTMIKDLLQLFLATKYKVAASPESFNSQIGVPLSLLTIRDGHDIAIIEAAISKTNEMDTLKEMIAPHCGILSHIGKKHLATLPDLQTAAIEMAKLFSHRNTTEWVLLPENAVNFPFFHQLQSQIYCWNSCIKELPHASFASLEEAKKINYRIEFPDDAPFLAEAAGGYYYFIDLINITVKAAWLLGIKSQAIVDVLSHYCLEPMRKEIWKSPSGPILINDMYGSDPLSIDFSLKQLNQTPSPGRKIFIFNGLRKSSGSHLENDYQTVAKAICNHKIDQLLTVGNHPFAPLEKELQSNLMLCHFASIKEALNHVRDNHLKDDTILIKGAKKESLDFVMQTFNDATCNNQCLINFAAIQNNLEMIRRKQPQGTRIMVMVKALAYGTDEVMMSKFLESCGIDILGVSNVEEGVNLRKAGIAQSIFVINAADFEAAKVVKWDLETGVSNRYFIEALEKEAMRENKNIKVHLHVDTGMGRFGCRTSEALDLAKQIYKSRNLQLEGIMTHFACAENPAEDHFTQTQIDKFDRVIESLSCNGIAPRWRHVSNSAAALRFDLPQYNMIRIGLATYGLYPSEAARQALDLRLALSLVSKIVGINICNEGESVSYGRSYKINKKREKIAVLPIGYFDGLHRTYSGKGHVMIRGQKAPMVGNICMDFMMVDVTEIPHASIGDPVLIFGEDEYGQYQSPEDLAATGDSIAHELITCLGPRIQRIFIYEEAHKKR